MFLRSDKGAYFLDSIIISLLPVRVILVPQTFNDNNASHSRRWFSGISFARCSEDSNFWLWCVPTIGKNAELWRDNRISFHYHRLLLSLTHDTAPAMSFTNATWRTSVPWLLHHWHTAKLHIGISTLLYARKIERFPSAYYFRWFHSRFSYSYSTEAASRGAIALIFTGYGWCATLRWHSHTTQHFAIQAFTRMTYCFVTGYIDDCELLSML